MEICVDYIEASKAGDHRHAQIIINSLGITYERSEGVAHTACFKFYNCRNIPDKLPPYVTAYRSEPYIELRNA